MICPKCKRDKEKDDFYCYTNNCTATPQQRWKICKQCVSEENKQKLKEKNEYRKYFSF